VTLPFAAAAVRSIARTITRAEPSNSVDPPMIP